MHKIIQRREVKDMPSFASDMHPVLARIYAARGIESVEETEHHLARLTPYHELLNIDKAVMYLAQALAAQKHILIIGDFDADGATSTALAVHALRAMGAKQVNFLVPNRFTYGYGLTPGIVDVAATCNPDLIITVDNGISSIDGVAAANAKGIDVIITDHHLPGSELPDALVIVNPNQQACSFTSKNIAGIGVIFYVMSALRAKLREENWFATQHITEPNMASYLDLVALGTVADVVALDETNRTLVASGLKRIRQGKMRPGIAALLQVAGRDAQSLQASDLGFALGPRLNAAGRLDDMSLGIACLLADDRSQALTYAKKLDTLNLERRQIEQEMKTQAVAQLNVLTKKLKGKPLPEALVLYESDWHQGVIGIVAGRIKETFHRPVIAFANNDSHHLKGSARSIPGLHIRDVLDRVASLHPDLIIKFGGHAMAAGLEIHVARLNEFTQAFTQVVASLVSEEQLTGKLLTDGPLAATDLCFDFAKLLQDAGPWGQAFPEPIFDNEFYLLDQRLVGGAHLKCTLALARDARPLDAIYFYTDLQVWPDLRCEKVHAAYQLDINQYQGNYRLQLILRELHKC